ncbi:MAG: putative metalloprotease CJM1_0395 family protein, partial [Deefgea sp.]
MSGLGAISSSSISYAAAACGPNCQCASCLEKKTKLGNSAPQANSSNQSTGQIDPTGKPLTSEQVAQVQQLVSRDREVRQHEQAHLAASGGLAKGAASYSMQTGPDGKQYAVGGEVSIDVSPGKTAEETLRKARIIQAAALAPADPSGQDRAVAAAAQAMEMQAQTEIAQRSVPQQKLA